LLSALDAVDAALTALGAYRLQLLGEVDQRGLATEHGARDTVEFLSLRHNRNRREIRRDLKLIKALPKYPAVTAALPDPTAPPEIDGEADSDGDGVSGAVVLTPGQAEAIVTTLEKAPPSVPDELLRVAEVEMVEVARLLTPDDLLRLGEEVLARLDTDGPEPAEDDACAKESLTLRRAEGGVKFSGYLAGENAEQLRTQINGLSKPHRTVDGEWDPRSVEKRQADALTQILTLAAGNTPRTDESGTAHSPSVPHLTITIDFDDLRNATTQGVGELVYGDNLSVSAVRRLACDAAILPIVLGSDSQPLDVGTEQRFVNRPIRRALVKRDKGCVICKAPPWQCHAHHLIHWADGGPTSITNLVLLCAGHHRAVHKGQWAITITGGVVQVTRPTWTTPGTTSATDLANLTALSRYTTRPTGDPVSVNPQYEHADRVPTTSLTRQPSTAPNPEAGAQPRPQADWPTSPLTGPQASVRAGLQPRPETKPPRSPQTSVQPGTSALPWLTPEAVALLDPWGDNGTPSAGP
jgi:hypothetical protein